MYIEEQPLEFNEFFITTCLIFFDHPEIRLKRSMISNTFGKSRLAINFHLSDGGSLVIAGSRGLAPNPLDECFVALNLSYLFFQRCLCHDLNHAALLRHGFESNHWINSRDGTGSGIVQSVKIVSLCRLESSSRG